MAKHRKDDHAAGSGADALEGSDTHVASAPGATPSVEERMAALEKRVRQLQSVLDALLQLRARDQQLDEEMVRRRAEAQHDVMGQVTARLMRRPSPDKPT